MARLKPGEGYTERRERRKRSRYRQRRKMKKGSVLAAGVERMDQMMRQPDDGG